MTRTISSTNAEKIERLNALLADAIREVLRRGFHGSVAVEISIQDGTIQNLRRKVERFEK